MLSWPQARCLQSIHHNLLHTQRGIYVSTLSFRLLLLSIILLVSGCASTTLVSSKKTEGAPVRKYRSLLVVGMSESPQTRQVFEEIFADELRKRGLKATAGYTIESLKSKPSRAAFADAMQKTGAEGLLSSRILDVKVKRDVKAGFVMTDRGVFIDDFYDYYGDYREGVGTYASFESKPVDEIISRVTTIETTLFDAATGRKIWTGRSNEADADHLIASTRELATLVLDALATEGLLAAQ